MSTVEIRISDQSEIAELRNLLEAQAGVGVSQSAGEPEPGEQGVADFLQVTAASGGAVVVAIKAIPEFIRSRRTDVSVSIKKDDREVIVTAANADDALRLVEKALGD